MEQRGLLFLLIYLAQFCFAQNYTVRQIDSLLFNLPRGKNKFNKEYILALDTKIIKASKILNYSKGVAYGNYLIAFSFNQSGNYNDSSKYLDIAKNEEYTDTNIGLKAKILDVSGLNFVGLGFYEEAKKEYRKELVEAGKLLNKTDKANAFSRVFGQISYVLSQQKNDSFGYYLKKSYSALNGVDEKSAFLNLQSLYPNLIDYYSVNNMPDSLKYIKAKAINFLAKQKNNDYARYGIYYNIGYDLYRRKRYTEALSYYLKALDAIKKTDYLEFRKNLYKDISRLYSDIDSVNREKEYLVQFVEANDTISKEKQIGTEEVLNEFIKQNNTDLKNSKSKLYLVITLIILSVVLIGYLGLRLHRKIIKKKERVLADSFQNLAEKGNIILQQKEEAQVLSAKLNSSLEKIIQMAKNNDPEFLIHFQEVYPTFIQKLLEINPTLVTSELKFCALLFFNFNLKDIAEYTFISTKTVQNRKNRIRKRLNIPIEENINRWIQNVGKE